MDRDPVRADDAPARTVQTKSPSPLARYGLATGAVAVAAMLRLALEPWLEHRSPYLMFTAPVAAAAAFGGLGPALLASGLSLALGLGFNGSGWLPSLLDTLTFVLVAAALIFVGGEIERLRRRSATSEQQAGERAALAERIAHELNLLIDGATEYAIYLLDPDGRVLIWNAGGERLKGWREREVVGQDAAMFYPADARALGKPEADLRQARALGKLEGEDWRLRKDGSEFLAHVSITALHDEAGQLQGYGKVVRDVTGQRAAERALRASANHLESILSTVPDAMIVIDEVGTILSFSKAAEALFGYAEAEIVGENISRLMPQPDRGRHDDYLRRYVETGEGRVIGVGRTVVGLRRDGESFPMELSVGEARGDGKRMFTGFIRDLTERHRTQARLDQLQSELIHVARVSAMGTMASTLAHELNQPIAAVASYAETVRDMLEHPNAEDFPIIREALADTVGQALRAGHIVRRLRDFVARGDLEKTIEDVTRLVDEALAMGLMGARETGVLIEVDIDPALGPVLVDRVQIQQVLINLARNAAEATAGRPDRRLWVSGHVEAPGMMRLTVSDNGPGISPAVADQLFTAFVSTKAEGMGLGLSISRTIVEAHGGRIWFEPRPEGGTRFHFTLVRADSEAIDV